MNHTTKQVRSELVDALRLDLIGPTNDHAFARELLPQSPSVWYLTGFLVPSGASAKVRTDASTDADEDIDSAEQRSGADDEDTPDKSPRRKGLLPASMGLSVLVPADSRELSALVSWGDYAWEIDGAVEAPPADLDHPLALEGASVVGPRPAASPGAGEKKTKRERKGYRRVPREQEVTCPMPKPGEKPIEIPIPGSDGLVIVVTARPVGSAVQRLPKGTRSVSVFVVNRREPREEHIVPSFAFQVGMELLCTDGFVPRVDPRYVDVAPAQMEHDECVADLHYRDVVEFAVGHGVSTEAVLDPDGGCRMVRTAWIPEAEVERVIPHVLPGIELSMETLGGLPDAAAAKKTLSPLVAEYRKWLALQRGKLAGLEPSRKKTAEELLGEAEWIADRIEHGIALLEDPNVLDAFRIASRAMARQARRRQLILAQGTITEAQADTPQWRPFQLAFLLMVMRGIVDPTCDDRERVDLLFFPTGGGKTEAYLGLAAFAMVLRRLRDPGPGSSGVCVLMRYTLRLLTLDQLGRATALICALELEREDKKEQLGTWPFEIGLWVGRGATPNRMGRPNDGDENSARARTLRYQSNSSRFGAPIPIEDCPWCGTKFQPTCFRLTPARNSTNLQVHCASLDCAFNGVRMLPIVAVDEPLYRRLPAFVIATIDKFAALPWTGQVGALFGLVDRHDAEGFYGPCDAGRGKAIGRQLPAPDLIIQDELHLISGPLGTIAGVYETAIDALCTREVGGKRVAPKIVASTATVRQAQKQIRALFSRAAVSVFPAPGPDRNDSFFARTVPSSEKPARLYVGVAAQGRSLKVIFLRTALAMLSVAQREWDKEGGDLNAANALDPYMTLLGYFNSLRELGGSRRIVEDEITSRLQHYGRRRRREPEDNTFVDRKIAYEPLELTSRVSTNEVADAKRRLALPFPAKDRVDVALATNMISVGLDIQRLGLMLVLGQPKTSAEYIQATSRVGRADGKPGLVITLLNVHKPRDRSHFERFHNYHSCFYRSVEATSVTPFSPRALDRALAATLVAMCRHGERTMTPADGAAAVRTLRAQLDHWVEVVAERARNHSFGDAAELGRLAERVRQRGRSLLDDWLGIANAAAQEGSGIQYGTEDDGINRRLLHEFLHPDLVKLDKEFFNFRAARSMRDVEPSADLTVSNLVKGPKL